MSKLEILFTPDPITTEKGTKIYLPTLTLYNDMGKWYFKNTSIYVHYSALNNHEECVQEIQDKLVDVYNIKERVSENCTILESLQQKTTLTKKAKKPD